MAKAEIDKNNKYRGAFSEVKTNPNNKRISEISNMRTNILNCELPFLYVPHTFFIAKIIRMTRIRLPNIVQRLISPVYSENS
jgi:hypothetical protein